MLFTADSAAGIADGSIAVTYRRRARRIDAHPECRAADLAASLGRDRDSWKRDVRKLKALGLTVSLEVGYRLSPRGKAYVEARRAQGR